MYEFENVHPKGKLVGDCVKRAFTKATGRDYQDISKELNSIKRELNAKSYGSDVVWKTFTRRHGMSKMSFPAVKGESRMNGHRFAEAHPKGTYILNMARHLSVCVDGVIYDTWDCRDKCVYTAFKVS